MPDLEHELLYRLLNPTGLPYARSEVHVGKVPAWIDLSFPPVTRILGSLERQESPVPPRSGRMKAHDHTQIELDSALPVNEWLRVFRGGLQGEWESLPMPGMQASGFLPASPSTSENYYSAAQELSLLVQAVPLDQGCQVTLHLNGMSAEQVSHMAHFALQPKSPALHAPSGVEVYPQGGGGGGDTLYYAATLVGEPDPVNLLAHFAPQMREQGWLEVGSSQAPLTFSQWRHGERGTALLTLDQGVGGIQGMLLLTGLEPGRRGNFAVTPLK